MGGEDILGFVIGGGGRDIPGLPPIYGRGGGVVGFFLAGTNSSSSSSSSKNPATLEAFDPVG